MKSHPISDTGWIGRMCYLLIDRLGTPHVVRGSRSTRGRWIGQQPPAWAPEAEIRPACGAKIKKYNPALCHNALVLDTLPPPLSFILPLGLQALVPSFFACFFSDFCLYPSFFAIDSSLFVPVIPRLSWEARSRLPLVGFLVIYIPPYSLP